MLNGSALRVPDVATPTSSCGATSCAGSSTTRCGALGRRTLHRWSAISPSYRRWCSRNDLIANTSVLLAAVLVAQLGALWPDVVVGVGIALLFLRSAVSVLREAARELANITRDPAAHTT